MERVTPPRVTTVLSWLPWVALTYWLGWMWVDGTNLVSKHAAVFDRPAISDEFAATLLSGVFVVSLLLCFLRAMAHVLGEWLPRRRLRPGRCPWCGYTVPSHGQQLCPECGQTSTSDQRGTPVPLFEPIGAAFWVARLALASLAGFMLGMLSSFVGSWVS